MDNIVNDDYYNWVMSQDFIFSLLYSPSIIPNMNIESQIVQIDTKKLEWASDKKTFFYIWGSPGADFNTYTAETYGYGWAFRKEELINAWKKTIIANKMNEVTKGENG